MEYEYRYGLVLLSVVLAIVSSFVAFGTASRIRHHENSSIIWVIGGGVSMGLGIWVMHFVGMFAYHIPISIAYDFIYTLLSIILAISTSIIALYIITSSKQLTLGNNLLSAMILASGISGMHYMGIFAMELAPLIQFNITLLVTSLVFAYAASFFAIRLGFSASKRTAIISTENTISAIILGVAISGMHYVAMGSMIIDPASICLALNDGITEGNITLLIVVSIFLILIVNAIILGYDLKLAEYESERVRLLAKKNQETLDIARRVTETLAAQYKESEEFNKKLFDTVANVVMVVDKDGYIVRINRAATNVTGYEEPELTGKQFWEVLIQSGEQDDFKKMFNKIVDGELTEHYTGTIITAYGDQRQLEWYYTELYDEESNVEFIIATGTDITEQKRYEEAMRLAAVSFETSEAICITDASGKILRVNEAFTKITGYTEEESYGETPSILKSGRHEDEFYANMWRQVKEKGYWYGEIWNKRKNGEIYPEWLRITAVYDDYDELTNYVATFSDISEIKQAEEQIHFYSNFDAATHLPNSKLFTELVDKELGLVRMDGHKGALLYIELIHLDKLTDNIGIGSVDSYINQLVKILYEKFGKELIIGRISNTDVALLLDKINDQQVISQSVDVAKFILQTVKQGLLIQGQMAYIHANIGIVDYSDKDTDSEELIQHANTAANRSRRSEPDSYQFYSAYMQKAATENYQLEVALREAIEQDNFELLLQPQVDIDDQLIGAEALLRWHRESEVVPPGKFIPIAEESNLIIDIGDWVLGKAMDYIKLIENGRMPAPFRNIAVNVSAIQIQQDNFIAKLKRLLIEKDVTPSYLKLELTESAILERPHVVINKISALKEIGVSVALDDFGTGYSSLAYLQKMQIDQLKIDRSFVSDLSINKTSQALTETIIVMAKNLGMEVIAEGVETRRERTILASYGCTQYQGYYYSRPIDFDAFIDFSQHPIQVEDETIGHP